ncbi:MAG: Thymidine kinase [uncultured bacterium (gcode 4)]|uniref:Thymidine kinase n=1 Tax=uncultured bacterium (gcode 4) TaxID=1234023 RepID=K2GZ65_9BACT|nr:MAG: Thymidine kinase [uncultured bacterium (gcode 4)]
MSKLYFQYWAMWAGKSLELLKVAYNYTERWRNVIIFNSELDTRFANWKVSSRSWSALPSISFNSSTDFLETIAKLKGEKSLDCILVDESQFLFKNQVDDLATVVTTMDIPVMCFWIKTDFLGNLFEWSKRLFEIAQKIEEIKTICWCSRKATMNARISNWKMTTEGEQIEIWENDKYISLCLKHYLEKNIWNQI